MRVKTESFVSYIIASINKWLHHHGFSYKNLKGATHKLKPKEQQALIDYYKGKLKSDDAPVLLMDTIHSTQLIKLSCSSIRKGQDKLVETTGNRNRVSLIDALPIATVTETDATADS